MGWVNGGRVMREGGSRVDLTPQLPNEPISHGLTVELSCDHALMVITYRMALAFQNWSTQMKNVTSAIKFGQYSIRNHRKSSYSRNARLPGRAKGRWRGKVKGSSETLYVGRRDLTYQKPGGSSTAAAASRDEWAGPSMILPRRSSGAGPRYPSRTTCHHHA